MISIAIVSRDYKQYEQLFAQSELAQYYTLVCACDVADHTRINGAEVILGEPVLNAPYILKHAHLRWFQSTWAGNNALQHTAVHPYTLTGVKGIFAEQMREYVMAYLLYFSRNIAGFTASQRTQTWQAAPYSSLAKKTLGILGMGNIGSGIADIAQQFNMNVVALSRRVKAASANQRHIMHFAPDQLLDMVKQCDFIVNLLPETPRTIGLCDADFFAAVKPESVFINVGRGSVIGNYTDLQNALNKGGLRAAVLDVFEQEPLANNHPLYSQTGVYITNHTAAESVPIKVFEVFASNAMRYAKGEALLYVHNFEAGY